MNVNIILKTSKKSVNLPNEWIIFEAAILKKKLNKRWRNGERTTPSSLIKKKVNGIWK